MATEIQVDENAKYGAPGAPIRGRLHLERLPDLERSAAATDYTAESNTRRRGDHAVDVSTMRAAVSNPARTDAARRRRCSKRADQHSRSERSEKAKRLGARSDMVASVRNRHVVSKLILRNGDVDISMPARFSGRRVPRNVM
jgi:hypothetical protein